MVNPRIISPCGTTLLLVQFSHCVELKSAFWEPAYLADARGTFAVRFRHSWLQPAVARPESQLAAVPSPCDLQQREGWALDGVDEI
ncbi:hypothetical protein N658DRAFT_225904 [Parathielavia hyrcaniae]|uniref:Uncharacterized protein n=1 Tax=Parathielavia hyrcaniae TaxID=113614 RepID=A0AAN6SYR8_9PEZI|nr:hypothetical protein N658DRAFT_225904 [Parathielavia hyrcaniae]